MSISQTGTSSAFALVSTGLSILVCALLFGGCLSPPPTPGTRTSLHSAAQEGNTAKALRIIETNSNPDIPDHIGFTPLLYAAENGDIAVAEALVVKGSRVNYTSPNGAAPLSAAAFSGSDAVVELLLAHGANPNISSPRVFSPLHCAAAK